MKIRVVPPRRPIHLAHTTAYPEGTDKAVIDTIFERARLLGEREVEPHQREVRVGWVVEQLEQANQELVSIPFHQAVLRLGLQPVPIRDEEGRMALPDEVVPFILESSTNVDALVIYSTGSIPQLAGAAGQMLAPLINGALVEKLIRQRQINTEPLHVWRALLETTLRLLPLNNP